MPADEIYELRVLEGELWGTTSSGFLRVQYNGLLPKKEPGFLSIHISGQNDSLYFVIQDNGIGRKSAQQRKKEGIQAHQSMGLAITRERLELLHQKLHKSTVLAIHDLYDANGHSLTEPG